MADRLPPGTMSIEKVAERAGLTVRSVSSYLARGDAPQPDYQVGRSPLWKEETIEAWLANRPGKGWRANADTRGKFPVGSVQARIGGRK